MRRIFLGCLFLIASVYAAGCNASLPEPESERAQLYTQRCSGCHRLYHPGLLTTEMAVYDGAYGGGVSTPGPATLIGVREDSHP